MYKNMQNLIEYSDGGILSKEIVKNDKMNVTLMCMGAGTTMSDHTSTRQGTVFIVEGRGIFTLLGEAISMSPGTLIHMKADSVHSLSVEENTSFVLTLVS